MKDANKVYATVVSQKGTCAAGHCTGDKFQIGDKATGSMCSWAFCTLFPFASALLYGGSFPWENDPDKATVACPDPGNPVVFELQRTRE